jgi:tetratricopeptide (TPR) repeat protein
MTTPTPSDRRPACVCGSGLHADRCCALDWAAPRSTVASADLAKARGALAANDVARAESLSLAMLERSPTDLPALALLYELRAAQSNASACEAILIRIVRLDPNNLGALQRLALSLINRGAIAEAEAHARNAVRMAPTDPLSHNLMGMIMTEAHQPQVGEHHYRRVLALTARPTAPLLANLAWNLKTQGRIDEARALYQQSTALDASRFQTFYSWARMEEADRNYLRALELLDLAERLSPGQPRVRLHRAVVQARLRQFDAALATLDEVERTAGGSSLDPNDWSDKGFLLDSLGRHAEAFEAFSQGKQLLRQITGQSYRADDASALVRRLKGFFTAPRLAILPRAEPRTDVAQPVFIMGFPRSGTTMIEQTLSAHPRISAGDELPIVNELYELAPKLLNSPLPYPEALADLWLGDHAQGLDLLRDYYLQRARQLGAVREGADWFTDKMPLNETHLGFISLMFPAAPIIHLVRHPLDVVLSVFSNHMTHGFYCGYDLESIARHYVLITDLVGHYRREASPRYLMVRYEDVIDDQDLNVRRMLDFIGAPFDARCLAFHENTRHARTASYAQVAEKLHDRARYRYRAYRQQLEPVIPILEPVIRDLGYAID